MPKEKRRRRRRRRRREEAGKLVPKRRPTEREIFAVAGEKRSCRKNLLFRHSRWRNASRPCPSLRPPRTTLLGRRHPDGDGPFVGGDRSLRLGRLGLGRRHRAALAARGPCSALRLRLFAFVFCSFVFVFLWVLFGTESNNSKFRTTIRFAIAAISPRRSFSRREVTRPFHADDATNWPLFRVTPFVVTRRHL